jgi:hypothetical protein
MRKSVVIPNNMKSGNLIEQAAEIEYPIIKENKKSIKSQKRVKSRQSKSMRSSRKIVSVVDY